MGAGHLRRRDGRDGDRVTADLRSYGVGVADEVEVVVRGSVARIGAASITLHVPADPNISAADVIDLEVWLPAESVVRAQLVAGKDPGPVVIEGQMAIGDES